MDEDKAQRLPSVYVGLSLKIFVLVRILISNSTPAFVPWRPLGSLQFSSCCSEPFLRGHRMRIHPESKKRR